MRIGKTPKYWLAASALCFVFGCSSSAQHAVIERPGGGERHYRVTVSSGGQAVDNHAEELVHRVELTPQQIKDFLGALGAAGQMPLQGKTELDNQGKPTGYRIKQLDARSPFSLLALRQGDLVTAVGTKHVKNPSDIVAVFDQLNARRNSSITIERGGKPHKILYTFSEAGQR